MHRLAQDGAPGRRPVLIVYSQESGQGDNRVFKKYLFWPDMTYLLFLSFSWLFGIIWKHLRLSNVRIVSSYLSDVVKVVYL